MKLSHCKPKRSLKEEDEERSVQEAGRGQQMVPASVPLTCRGRKDENHSIIHT